MISSFKYLSPIQEAYSAVQEAETTVDNQTKELLDSKKRNPYRMSDEERRLFYQDEIKRLRGILKYYEQQRRYGNRDAAPQGNAMYSLRSTIEKYQRELDKMNQTSPSSSPSQNVPNP